MAEVNDQEVKRIIDQELLTTPGQTVVEKTHDAWQALKARRRDGAHGTDVNLAAAEHYDEKWIVIAQKLLASDRECKVRQQDIAICVEHNLMDYGSLNLFERNLARA